MAGMTVPRELLTVPEAAVAGVSVRTMRRWASSGQVRTTGSGHRRRVVAASLPGVEASEDASGREDRSPEDTVSATTDAGTVRSANSDSVAAEADRLADLVRELTGKLAEQTGLTMVWMERARVLGERLALAAPDASHSPIAAQEPSHGTVRAQMPVRPACCVWRRGSWLRWRSSS
jgi:hypothetical protein